jgi:hypothetical protein
MVKKKICRNGVIEGFWKGERVGLIPRYHPDCRPDDYVIEEVEVVEDDSYPRLIDPLEVPLVEIKEICEGNGVSFFWVTGLSQSEKDDLAIRDGDTLGSAIELFIAMNSAGSTPAQYRRFFESLVRNGIIDFAWAVGKYKEQKEEVIDKAYALPIPEKKEGEARYRNRYILTSLHAFLEHPSHYEVRKTTGNYQSKRRKDCLTDEEAEIFFPALKKINPIYELIGQILRYYNREMFENPAEAFIVPIEYLLQMQVHQVGNDNVPSIYGHKLGRSIQFALYLRDDLFERLVKLANQNDLFVFQNRRGGPIDSGQVRRAFRETSKACGLRDISPSHLC